MSAAGQSQRHWVHTIHRFLEVGWVRHGATRYASVFVVPMVVALTTPGWWWLACAAGAGAGVLTDMHVRVARAAIAHARRNDRA